MKKYKLSLYLLAIGCLLLPFAADAKTINLYDDFPDIQGENGFYAYKYNPGYLPPYQELTRVGPYNFKSPSHSFEAPFVRRYSSPDVWLHPSAVTQIGYLEDAVLAWVVPENNTYNISGRFYDLDPGGDGVNVYIRRNDSFIWGSNHLAVNGSLDFSLVGVVLNAGDYLYFGVNAGGTDYYDSTCLRGAIEYTPIPLPGAVWLLGSGLLGLVGLRRSLKN